MKVLLEIDYWSTSYMYSIKEYHATHLNKKKSNLSDDNNIPDCTRPVKKINFH